MAIGIQNYDDISPADSEYPDGNIKDDTGADDGTPVEKTTYADMHQTLAKLLRLADITPSGNPENEYSGFQYIEAMDCLYSDGRQKVTVTGAAASTICYGSFNTNVIYRSDAESGHFSSLTRSAAPLIGKIKVTNYSFNPVTAVDSIAGTVNGGATFVVPSRAVCEFQWDNASNWALISYFIMP